MEQIEYRKHYFSKRFCGFQYDVNHWRRDAIASGLVMTIPISLFCSSELVDKFILPTSNHWRSTSTLLLCVYGLGIPTGHGRSFARALLVGRSANIIRTTTPRSIARFKLFSIAGSEIYCYIISMEVRAWSMSARYFALQSQGQIRRFGW